VHPYDLPDESHPPARPVPELEPPPETMPSEWINAEALHAAVGHASAWMHCDGTAWGTEDVLRVAKVYRKFITGEMP
jgi:hypothetical protein